MTRKNEIKDELEGRSTSLQKLKSLGADLPNDLPNNYFENLGEKVESELFDKASEKQSSPLKIKLWWFAGAAVAASIALFFLVQQPKQQISFPEMEQLSLNEQLVMSEMDAFEMEYLIEMDSYTDEIEAENLLLDEDDLENLINM